MSIQPLTLARGHAPARRLSPAATRAVFTLLVAGAAVAGALATGSDAAHAATARAGADLTRLLRLMALIKVAMAAAVVGGVVWRLGWPVSSARFAAYVMASAATVAGPGLIWGMAHVGLGALLLHAGLVATVVLLWRDPAVEQALAETLKRRGARR